MGELVFIGLGLWDERDMSLKALEEAKACQVLFAEFYTSRLLGTTHDRLQKTVGKPITLLRREQVEDGRLILAAAKGAAVGFLVPGEPMAATTHVELRLRAEALGIRTRMVHGASIFTAAPALLGLQVYKFGRTTTIPRPSPGFHPSSPYRVVEANRAQGLHSLLLLDLTGEPLTAKEALQYLQELEGQEGKGVFTPDTVLAVLSRVGSTSPRVTVGPLRDLLQADLGEPLQCLVLPGNLHFTEEEALAQWRQRA